MNSKNLLILLFLFLLSSKGYCQVSDSTFNYNDSTLSFNKVKIIVGFNFLKSDSMTEGAYLNNPQLFDSLIFFLKKNPLQDIQMNMYSSCRTKNEEYNLKRSKWEVEGFKNYIISKGIDENRISVYGGGFSKPIVYCDCGECSREELVLNRRLEIITTK